MKIINKKVMGMHYENTLTMITETLLDPNERNRIIYENLDKIHQIAFVEAAGYLAKGMLGKVVEYRPPQHVIDSACEFCQHSPQMQQLIGQYPDAYYYNHYDPLHNHYDL